jgi:uncharacterized protein with FMN-binding domain
MKKTIIIAAIMLLVAGTATLDARTKKASNKKAASTTQVIYTGDIAKKVIGYNGPVPVKIYIKKNKVEKVEVLKCQESPKYLAKVKRAILDRWNGLKVKNAASKQVDAVTGATYTSEALIQNVKLGLDYYQRHK